MNDTLASSMSADSIRWINMIVTHRYTRAIPQPVPFSSRYGAQIRGILGFSRNQNNCDSSGAYVLRSECQNKHSWNATQHTKIVDEFCLRVWLAKTRIPAIWAPWLTTRLHGAVYEVWNLPCIPVMRHELSQCTEACPTLLPTLTDATVASSGKWCHCFSGWHNFPVLWLLPGLYKGSAFNRLQLHTNILHYVFTRIMEHKIIHNTQVVFIFIHMICILYKR